VTYEKSIFSMFNSVLFLKERDNCICILIKFDLCYARFREGKYFPCPIMRGFKKNEATICIFVELCMAYAKSIISVFNFVWFSKNKANGYMYSL
jgi:hypothetical protein